MQGSYAHVVMLFPVAVVVIVCAVVVVGGIVVGDGVVDLIMLVADVAVTVPEAGSPAASTQYE